MEHPAEYFNIRRGASLEQRKVEPGLIDQLVEERVEARTAKDWQRADDIRQQLEDMDIQLEDRPDGTVWKFKD